MRRLSRRICLVASITTIALYCYFNSLYPAWSDPKADNLRLITAIENQRMMPFLITPNLGRFWPIGEIDYNLLLPVGNRPGIFLAYVSLKLCIFVFLFSIVLKKIAPDMWPYLLLAFVLTPALPYDFSNTFFGEANTLILLSAFVLSYLKAMDGGSRKYQLISALLAVLVAYTKEPGSVGLAALGISAFYLPGSKEKRFMKPLNIFLVVNAVTFLIIAYLISYRHRTVYYGDLMGTGNQSIASFLALASGNDRLMLFFIFVGMIRFVDFIFSRRKSRGDLFVCAGSGYLSVYVGMRMYGEYLFLPAEMLFMVGLAHYLHELVMAGRAPVAFRTSLLVLFLAASQINGLIGAIQYPVINRHKALIAIHTQNILRTSNRVCSGRAFALMKLRTGHDLRWIDFQNVLS
jgi:hypothetical protein